MIKFYFQGNLGRQSTSNSLQIPGDIFKLDDSETESESQNEGGETENIGSNNASRNHSISSPGGPGTKMITTNSKEMQFCISLKGKIFFRWIFSHVRFTQKKMIGEKLFYYIIFYRFSYQQSNFDKLWFLRPRANFAKKVSNCPHPWDCDLYNFWNLSTHLT